MKKTFDIWSMNCERLYALRKKRTNSLYYEVITRKKIHYDTLQYAKLFDDKLEAEEELELIKENGFDTSDLEIVELSIIIEINELEDYQTRLDNVLKKFTEINGQLYYFKEYPGTNIKSGILCLDRKSFRLITMLNNKTVRQTFFDISLDTVEFLIKDLEGNNEYF